MNWSVRFTKQAQKDARKLAAASPALKAKAEQLLQLLAEDPFRLPPPYEALVGDLAEPSPFGSTSSTGSSTRSSARKRS